MPVRDRRRRRRALALLLIAGVAVVPAVAAPVEVTQELTFKEVLPFGAYSDGPLLATEWSVNPWPLTDASQIT